jgi:hypothetical protein
MFDEDTSCMKVVYGLSIVVAKAFLEPPIAVLKTFDELSIVGELPK